ncbi:MAG: 50S ribosomal protein L25/general stress protein Ctc [Candidatus Competibacteraceae bacterium]|jgi:large subunit ribosomal protein L25|nr:50S ribosomal protein L25/general stress protein Ctc [Candidatus Competibacteraceae bacterium]
MTLAFELTAETRDDRGKGASRRLRRQGRIPAIIYGGGQPPEAITLNHQQVLRQLANEAFYSHILQVNVGSRTEQVILRDLQRHPFKPTLLHMDLFRVTADQKLRVHVPLHFINEQTSVGVKLQGGIVSHLRIEVEVSCLPKALPEFIEVDLAQMEVGDSIHLSELQLPPGVELVELAAGTEHDGPIVSIQGQRSGSEEEEGEATDEDTD